jgi:hypothetical protein
MSPSEIVSALGRTAREAARSEVAASEFSRAQLMSAYSASRHLAVELGAFAAEIEWFARAAARELRGARDGVGGVNVSGLASELELTTDAQRAGDLVSQVLDALRHDPSSESANLRVRLHTLLRQLSEREVELLSEAIEGAPPA